MKIKFQPTRSGAYETGALKMSQNNGAESKTSDTKRDQQIPSTSSNQMDIASIRQISDTLKVRFLVYFTTTNKPRRLPQ